MPNKEASENGLSSIKNQFAKRGIIDAQGVLGANYSVEVSLKPAREIGSCSWDLAQSEEKMVLGLKRNAKVSQIESSQAR